MPEGGKCRFWSEEGISAGRTAAYVKRCPEVSSWYLRCGSGEDVVRMWRGNGVDCGQFRGVVTLNRYLSMGMPPLRGLHAKAAISSLGGRRSDKGPGTARAGRACGLGGFWLHIASGLWRKTSLAKSKPHEFHQRVIELCRASARVHPCFHAGRRSAQQACARL